LVVVFGLVGVGGCWGVGCAAGLGFGVCVVVLGVGVVAWGACCLCWCAVLLAGFRLVWCAPGRAGSPWFRGPRRGGWFLLSPSVLVLSAGAGGWGWFAWGGLLWGVVWVGVVWFGGVVLLGGGWGVGGLCVGGGCVGFVGGLGGFPVWLLWCSGGVLVSFWCWLGWVCGFIGFGWGCVFCRGGGVWAGVAGLAV
jgi:hypothetical protein